MGQEQTSRGTDVRFTPINGHPFSVTLPDSS